MVVLNTLQCIGQPSTTKDYLAQNPHSSEDRNFDINTKILKRLANRVKQYIKRIN
jgi:hypothetical protein